MAHFSPVDASRFQSDQNRDSLNNDNEDSSKKDFSTPQPPEKPFDFSLPRLFFPRSATKKDVLPKLGEEREPGLPERDGFQGVPDAGDFRDVTRFFDPDILGIVTSHGGRHGNPPARQQLDKLVDNIIKYAEERGCKVTHIGGGKRLATTDDLEKARVGEDFKEPYLKPRYPETNPDGSVNKRRGASYADLGFEGPNGNRLYVNTYDVLRSMFLPTSREKK